MIDALCLALVVYFEARSEPIEAQADVAGVVIERVASERYPDTVCEVAFQRKQFSAFNSGLKKPKNMRAWQTSMIVAKMVLDDPEGVVQIRGATHYHTVNVKPYWAKHYTYLGQSGDHLFYGPAK